jgi:hypothetical protein
VCRRHGWERGIRHHGAQSVMPRTDIEGT